MRKLAVITGGSRGMGRAIVSKLMGQDMDVITCSRSQDDLDDLKKTMENDRAGGTLFTCRSDLSVREEIFNFVSYIRQINRPVDLLVNNAGVYLPGQIHDEPEKNLEFLLMVNLISAYHITRGVLETMIPRRSGHIFNIGSTASILAYPNGGSYCISKFAMYGMTKVLREELKELGIRVTAVLPGATFTQSWLGTDLPEERFMKPADIAETIWSAYNLSGNTVVEEVIMRPQLGDIL